MAVVVWPCEGDGLNKHLIEDIRIVLKDGVVWDEEHDVQPGTGRYHKES
jgi:hypothetical protein